MARIATSSVLYGFFSGQELQKKNAPNVLLDLCSVRDYFHEYFTGLVSGRTDYENLMPWSVVSQG